MPKLKSIFFFCWFLFSIVQAQVNSFDKGFAAYEKGKYEIAVDYYTSYIEESASLNAYFNRGLAYHKLKDYEKAIFDFSYVINEDEEDYEALLNRALCYYETQEYQKAIRDNQKALELNPNFYKAYTGLGIIYAAIDQHADAIEMYGKAIELKPNASIDYYKRALSYQSLKMYDKAEKDYTKAIELSPKNTAYLRARADLYYEKAIFDLSITDLSTAIDITPENADLYYNRGIAYYDTKNYVKAEKDFQEYLRYEKEDLDAMWYLTLCAKNLGNETVALDYYNKVKSINPEYEHLNTVDTNQLKLKKIVKENWLYSIVIFILLLIAFLFFIRILKQNKAK